MTAPANKQNSTYNERLANFAGELRDHVHDKKLLEEIHGAIQKMLASEGVTEAEIRNALQRQYDAGKLREESFELVQKLLDRIVLDGTTRHTDAAVNDPPETAAPAFTSTDVIPGGPNVKE